MKKKKHIIVDVQKTQIIGGDENAYERYVDMSEDQREDVRANPDSLPESFSSAPSSPQLIMGEAIEHLQGRQREVYTLVMREGKSLAEAGHILGITKATAQDYRDRAIKFITAYCKQAINGGRV